MRGHARSNWSRPLAGDSFHVMLCLAILVVVYRTSLPESSNPADRETQRLQEHFARIDRELSRVDVSHLTAQQRANREGHLTVLQEYAQRGRFPHNHTGTLAPMPVFVDEHGTHCAVGHLIALSGRRDLVDDIKTTANLATIRALSIHPNLGPKLAEWIEESGLTVDEAARIQPSYRRRRGTGLSDGLCYVNEDGVVQCQTPVAPLPTVYLVASGFTALIAFTNSLQHPTTETQRAWRRSVGGAAGATSVLLGLGGLAAEDDVAKIFGGLNVVLGIAFIADAVTEPGLMVAPPELAGNGWAAQLILDVTPAARGVMGVSVEF